MNDAGNLAVSPQDPFKTPNMDPDEGYTEKESDPDVSPADSLMSVHIRRVPVASKSKAPAPRRHAVPRESEAGTNSTQRSAGGTAQKSTPDLQPSGPRRPEEIVAYWARLRNGRNFPSTSDLDPQRLAADWPNSMLIRCRSGSKVLQPEETFPGPGANALGPNHPAKIDLSPLMLQWVLSLAGEAANEKRPVEDIEAFPTQERSVRYRAFALPLSEDQGEINHVLCHVCRAD